MINLRKTNNCIRIGHIVEYYIQSWIKLLISFPVISTRPLENSKYTVLIEIICCQISNVLYYTYRRIYNIYIVLIQMKIPLHCYSHRSKQYITNCYPYCLFRIMMRTICKTSKKLYCEGWITMKMGKSTEKN